MARTITEIQEQIKAALVTNMAAIGVVIDPSTWSYTDIRGIWIYLVSFCFWSVEKLFDVHKAETDEKIASLKPHSTRWYAEKAKLFRFGINLVPETGIYDNTGLTEDQIITSQVVKYCAVVEQEISANRFGLRIKVATINGDDLDALPAPQLAAFIEYQQQIKDAGIGLLITTGPADSLKLRMQVYYNPLVLNNSGQRLDGTDTEPVQKAIRNYLTRLPFNGIFVLAYLVDAIQQVEGVVIPHLLEAKARYGILPYIGFGVEYLPDAGYLRFVDPADLEIQWIPRSAV